jgi:aminopeptidase N
MKTIALILFLSITSLASTAQNLKSGGILKPEQAVMDVRHYKITLRVDPDNRTIDGETEVRIVTSDVTTVLVLDLVNLLTVRKIWVNNREQNFTHLEDVIRIELSKPLAPGNSTIRVAYGGKPGIAERAPWVGGFSWAKDSLGNHWVAITCQGEGAKIYFPCKDHPSDEPNDGAELIITVPQGLVVAGPGLLRGVRTRGHRSTYHWQTRYTINNYNILFNIGKYEVVERTHTTIDGNKVPMQFYVLSEHKHRANSLMDIFERSVRVQEKYFGEYPWVKEKLAICETPHLGMEHQTLNAYGNKFNFVKVGGQDFDRLLHHELGHEWWGNKVTGIDWADMWIQEGICVFGDHLYIREYEGEEAYLKRMQETARLTQNIKPVVQGRNLDTDVVYHSDIYGKGGFFMHSLRYVVGDEIFFPTLKKLSTDSRYTYDNFVSTDDVEELFSGAAGQDLKPFFDLLLRTVEKLEFHVRYLGGQKYHISLSNLAMSIPVDVVSSEGKSRIMVNKAGIELESKVWPVIDPDVYYLKKVVLE